MLIQIPINNIKFKKILLLESILKNPSIFLLFIAIITSFAMFINIYKNSSFYFFLFAIPIHDHNPNLITYT